MSTLGTLFWLRVRRDRVQLIVWPLVFAFLAALVSAAVTGSYGAASDRAEVLRIVIQTPAVLMLRGTPQGTAADAFSFFLIFGFLCVLIGLMNTFLAVRHTRAEEESGRAELVGATPASRFSPLFATTIEGVLLTVLIGVISALGYLMGGSRASSSWLAGASLAAVGLVFLGVGLACAQLMRTSRGANGLAAAIVTLAYVLRGLGDATGTVHPDGLSMTTGWLSWLSPIGWGAAVRPFSEPTAPPLLFCLALGALLIGASLALQAGSDIDSSVVPEQAGRSTASAALRGPVGLAWRMLRGPTIGWMLAAGLFGLLIGGLGQAISDLTRAGTNGPVSIENELRSLAGGDAKAAMTDIFVVAMLGLMGAIAAIAAVQAIMRARHDEASGTAELLLATPLGRRRWFLSHLAMGVITALLVLAASLLGTAFGLARSPDLGDRLALAARAALVQVPAVLVLLGVMALVFALVPRLTIGLGWGILIAAIFVGQFGDLLGLPAWLRGVSPFTHTPIVTGPDVDWSGPWWMLAIAIGLAALATVRVRHRDLVLSA